MSRSRTGTVDRRTFVKDAALASASAAGLSGGLGALSGLWAQPRASAIISRPLFASGEPRAFNMICLGDSVMWGQGLRDESKFTTRVKTWLESQLPGRAVNSFVYARSGATIGPDKDVPDKSAVQPWMNNRALGEVPASWPWIQQQVIVAQDDLASQNIPADTIDLVLLDGGINDIDVTTLLSLTSAGDPHMIRQKSREFCGTGMGRLLPKVRDKFPNAKIVVTGYFPIISEDSDLAAIGILLTFLFPPGGFALTWALRQRLAEQSRTWYDASNTDLSTAVAEFNRGQSMHPMYHTHPAGFARIPWTSNNCYAAPSSYLWLFGLPHDEVWSSRQWACRTAGVGGDPLCQEAKVGHPNPAGAGAYAHACKTQLEKYLPEWRGNKLMSACVDMDPMPGVNTPTTLTVRATERGGGALAGTVRVGEVRFPTDTAVPLTLCTQRRRSVGGATTAAGREREPVERTTVTVCTPMIVSAPGYVDVVIKDYLAAKPVP